MKKFFALSVVLFCTTGLVFTACNSTQNNPTAVTVVADAELVLNLEGMTCEMGCKKAIEKVLSNTPGVATGKVVYEEARAYVAFNQSLVDEAAIITAINESYEGAYKATKVAE